MAVVNDMIGARVDSEPPLASRPSVRWYLGLAAAYWVVLLNWWFEWFRLHSQLANYVVMLAALAIPLVLVAIGLWLRGWKAKLISALLALPLVACSVVLGFFTWVTLWDIATTGNDPSFERLRTISVGDSQVTLYRTNGGAMTSFGLAIRQEKTLLPGLLLVKRIDGFYPACDAELAALPPNKVKVSVVLCGTEGRGEEAILSLKRFVYL